MEWIKGHYDVSLWKNISGGWDFFNYIRSDV